MTGSDGVRRFRRKPLPPRETSVTAARYEPGKPLDGLMRVAAMADDGRHDAEMAEVILPSGPVLLVRTRRYPSEGLSETAWEVIEPGGYLAFSGTSDYSPLSGTDEAELQRWYEEVT